MVIELVETIKNGVILIFWPVSKFNTGSLPLCGILPVIMHKLFLRITYDKFPIYTYIAVVNRKNSNGFYSG